MIDQRRSTNSQPEWISKTNTVHCSYCTMPMNKSMEESLSRYGPVLSSTWQGEGIDLQFHLGSSYAEGERKLQTNWAFAPDGLHSPLEDGLLMNGADITSAMDHVAPADCCLYSPDDASSWALSPYSELDNVNNVQLLSPYSAFEAAAPETDFQVDTPSHAAQFQLPELNRQSSLNMVLEVLGESNVESNGHSLAPAALQNNNGRHADIPTYPATPCWSMSRQRSISWAGATDSINTELLSRTRTVSEDPALYIDPCLDIESLLKEAFSVDAAIHGAAGNSNNNNNTGSCSPPDDPTSVNVSSHCNEVSLVVDGPFDGDGMLQEIFSTGQHPVQVQEVEVNTTLQAVTVDHPYSTTCITTDAVSVLDEKSSSADANVVIDVVTPSTSTAKLTSTSVPAATPSTSTAKLTSTSAPDCSDFRTQKRNMNNQACRESRKRRKLVRKFASENVAHLTTDNQRLRQQIQSLELQVKETKALLLSKITRKAVS